MTPLLRHDDNLASCSPKASDTGPDCDDCKLARKGQSSIVPG